MRAPTLDGHTHCVFGPCLEAFVNVLGMLSCMKFVQQVVVMSNLDQTMVEDVLALPQSAKEELLSLLMESLNKKQGDVEPAWMAEAESRVDGYLSGELQAKPWNELMAKYQTK